MALQSQLLHDLERGVQWIASALRQRNPDGFAITLEQPHQDVWRWLVAGEAFQGCECCASLCWKARIPRPHLT